MAVVFPYVKFRAFADTTNLPLVGGKLYSYEINTLTPKALYADPNAVTPLSNPVILDSNGEATIYGVGEYDLALTDSLDSPMWTADDVQFGSASTAAATAEWIDQDGPFTYISATYFSVIGDQVTTYQRGRRVKIIVTAGTAYGFVNTSVFGSGVTTVQVVFDSIDLDTGLSAVAVSILGSLSPSLPFWPEWTIDTGGNLTILGQFVAGDSITGNSLVVTLDAAIGGETTLTGGMTTRPFNLAKRSYVQEDFNQGFVADGQLIADLPWAADFSLPNGNLAFIDSETSHTGIIRMTTASTNHYLAGYRNTASNSGNMLPAEFFDSKFVIRGNQNDINTLYRVGWADNPASNPPNNGIYMQRATTDTNWQLVTRASATPTTTDSAVLITTSFIVVRLRRVSGSSIGITIGSNTEVVVSTNIPTAVLYPFFQIQSASGTKTLDIDYFDNLISSMSR